MATTSPAELERITAAAHTQPAILALIGGTSDFTANNSIADIVADEVGPDRYPVTWESDSVLDGAIAATTIIVTNTKPNSITIRKLLIIYDGTAAVGNTTGNMFDLIRLANPATIPPGGKQGFRVLGRTVNQLPAGVVTLSSPNRLVAKAAAAYPSATTLRLALLASAPASNAMANIALVEVSHPSYSSRPPLNPPAPIYNSNRVAQPVTIDLQNTNPIPLGFSHIAVISGGSAQVGNTAGEATYLSVGQFDIQEGQTASFALEIQLRQAATTV